MGTGTCLGDFVFISHPKNQVDSDKQNVNFDYFGWLYRLYHGK